MKALVISPQPFFSPRGTPFSVYYRTLLTAEAGVEIDLLTYGEGTDADIPGVRIIRIPRFGVLGNVKVGPSVLKLFLDIFIFVWAVGLLLRHRYDFVHAHEESVFFCRFLKPFFGFRLVYDMHSSLPQQLRNFEFTESALITGTFKKLEDSCLHSADAVITICPDLSDYVDNLISDKHKHLMIENSIFEPVRLVSEPSNGRKMCAETPVNEKNILKTLPQGKRFVVYAGTLEAYQGIEILIEAFKGVTTEISDAFLVIVGGSQNQVEYYSALAKHYGVNENICFTGRVPQVVAQNYCRIASVQVSPRSSGTNTPLKIYEQLASGIPLVATNIYSHTQVLDNSIAFLTAPDPSDMARGIIMALEDHEKSQQIATNARRVYQIKYSRPIYEQKMRKMLSILSDDYRNAQ